MTPGYQRIFAIPPPLKSAGIGNAKAADDIDAVLDEMRDSTSPGNRYPLYRRKPRLEVGGPADGARFFNLDGEPFSGALATIRFEVLNRRLAGILPLAAEPLLQQTLP